MLGYFKSDRLNGQFHLTKRCPAHPILNVFHSIMSCQYFVAWRLENSRYTQSHTMEGKAGYSLECKGNRVTGRGLAVQIMLVRCCFVFEGQDPTFNQNTCMHVLGIQGFRLGLANYRNSKNRFRFPLNQILEFLPKVSDNMTESLPINSRCRCHKI